MGSQPVSDLSTGLIGTTPDLADAALAGKRGGAVAKDDGSKNLVNSLSKGLRVLEAFTAERPEMTLSEVARAASLDPGTAFRMLNTLNLLGYVARVPGSKRFRLTLKVIDLGLHAIGRSDLRELARPILRSLVGETTEAASIGVIDGGDIIYIERVRAGLTRLSVDIRIGTNIPAVIGVIGHAILAFLPEAERERVLAIEPRRSILEAGPFSKDEFRQMLDGVRQRGYAMHDSPFHNGLRILAAPVLDTDGFPLAAISVVAPAMHTPSDQFLALALEPVRKAAAAIARAIQASGTISAAAV